MSVNKELTYKTFVSLYKKKKMTLEEIGNMYGVSKQRAQQIKSGLEKIHGKIKRNEEKINPLTLQFYLKKKMTIKEIAEELNVNPNKIVRSIKRFQDDYNEGNSSIEIKIKKSKDILTKEKLKDYYEKKKLTDKEIAKLTNLSVSTIRNLRKDYQIEANHSKKLRHLREILPKEKLNYLLNEKKETQKKISKQYECSISSLNKLKKEYNL